MNDQTIEQEIQAKGLTAPRITPADLKTNIAGEYFFTAADGVQAAFHSQDELTRLTGAHGELALLTFCVLVLKNGFTVTGESACASPENFNAEIGRKIARQNAEQKIWPLMGYELKERLFQRTQPTQAPTE
ncbi:Gp49 family protein [Pseudomonas sp. VE 196-7]|uniref:Gp49 family protein n=1 Tax=Pseudomonas sp. VE 196-7 TaxID=2956726 RepID=UPI0021D4D41D|nr:Gp49 family protein [Pseudomonas sp. VE 196-7]MCU7218031.1 Gp49 family protein [Pseudomonas sp. VE 196-7]